YRSLRALPLNVFVRLLSFLAHATFGEHNPVLLGRGRRDVTVIHHGSPVPPFDEDMEEAGVQLLEEVLAERLLPLGCVQVGLTPGKKDLYIARRPGLDVFFGHEPEAGATTATPADVGRV